MLMPKKVKHRKTQRGRLNGQAKGGAAVVLRRLRHSGHGARVVDGSPD